MNEKVAKSGSDSSPLAAQPHDERGRQRHQLPKEEQRQKVPGKDRAQRSTCVTRCRYMLRVIVHVDGVDHPDERQQREDAREQQTESVYPAEDEFLPQGAHHAYVPGCISTQSISARTGRSTMTARLVQPEQRKDPRAGDEQQADSTHSTVIVVFRTESHRWPSSFDTTMIATQAARPYSEPQAGRSSNQKCTGST